MHAFDPERHRISELKSEGMVTLYTIERPFISNAMPGKIDSGVPYVSSVPCGIYLLHMRDSPKHGQRWHYFNPQLGVYLDLEDCPDIDESTGRPIRSRFSTMFHSANHVAQVQGCTGAGKRLANFGSAKGLGVGSSRDATAILEDHLDGDTIAQLTVI